MPQLRSEPSASQMSRWARIKRLSHDELEYLHKIESKAWKLAVQAGMESRLLTDEMDWQLVGERYLHFRDIKLGPFWPIKSDIAWRESELKRFNQRIYPGWRPIWDLRDNAALLLEGDASYISEMEAVHRIDLKVHEDEYRFPPKKMPKSGEVENDSLKESIL